MKFRPYAKAIAAALAGGLTPQAYALLSGATPFTAANVKESLLGLFAAGLTTFQTSNGKSVSETASSMVVKLKIDLAKFVAFVLAGLPDLVQRAAEAAIAPASDPAPAADVPAPADPAAATVEPAILGKA
jgi:hypothetical protein